MKKVISPADKQATERNYGIDALRIVSMLLVVILHVLGQGGVLSHSTGMQNRILWLLEVLAYCAVNCYALISGYVGVFSKYKLSNLALLWLRVAFYTVSLTILFKVLYPDNVRILSVVSAFSLFYPTNTDIFQRIFCCFCLFLS